MKISFNPIFCKINTQKINKKNQLTTNSIQAKNDILKNSMAEVIGRSQSVSFTGSNRYIGNIFEHTCRENFGLSGKETIKYNKEDGSLRHEVYGIDGNIKEVREFYPQRSTEIITQHSNGEKSITIKTPDNEKTEKFDSTGRQILFDYKDRAGNKKRIETDYKRLRQVIREQHGYEQEHVTVYDLKTGLSVVSGDLVIDTRYDQTANANITENIVTKQILKIEYLRQNGTTDRIIEYVKGTGFVEKETYFDPKTGACTEIEYNVIGENVPVKSTTTSKDRRRKQIIHYEDDGKTIKSNILYGKLRNGKLEYKVEYYGNTGKIISKENYNEDTTIRTLYGETPNIPQKEEVFSVPDNALIEESYFYDDGKTKHRTIQYDNNAKQTRDILFDTRGREKQIKYYAFNGFLQAVENFDPKTGNLVFVRTFNEYNGYYQDTYYSPITKKAERKETYTSKNRIVDETEFYENSYVPRYEIKYNPDGSYTKTTYNEDGSVRREQEYYSDGTKKKTQQNAGNGSYNSSQQNSNRTNNAQSSTHYSRPKAESEDAFLERIGEIAADRDKSIMREFNESDWRRLSQILGISSVEEVIHMDKGTYRKLAKLYHPDTTSGDKDRSKKIFQIITEIYNKK